MPAADNETGYRVPRFGAFFLFSNGCINRINYSIIMAIIS